MKTTYRLISLASVLALGVSSITVPAQADPGPATASSTMSTHINNIPASSMSFGTGETVNEVRLVTGDLVGLNADGTVTTITPGPRPDRSQPRFSVMTAQDGVFVIPGDVESLIPDQLDRQLFNVTKLASYDLTTAIPVIVAQPESTGAQADADIVADLGVEVTDSLDSVSAQVGLADVTTDDGPAPTWDLLKELDSAPTASNDPVSSDTKVWLDQQVRIDPPDMVLADDEPGVEPAWMSLIGRDEAHAEGYNGEGVLIGVVDTGIDSAHPDLAGQVIAEQDFTDSGSASDGFGHGTFVASEIAGTGVASAGAYAGVAPGAKLINARVLDSYGNGSDSAIVAGLQWAAEQGADVINMSLGAIQGYDDGSSFISQAINQISRDFGTLIVVAAGNDGNSQTVEAPATADEAIAVGATYEDGSLAVFSSYGPRRGDGAVKPEILAPGSDTISGSGIMGAQAGTEGYMNAQGTSMATPLVAGAAALVKQADPSLDRTQIRAKLMASAQELPLSVFQQGAGLLNIPAAIAQTVTTTPTQLNLGTMPIPYPDEQTATLTYHNDSDHDVTYDLSSELTFTVSRGQPVEILPDDEPQQAGMVEASQTDTDVSGTATLSVDTLTVPAGGTASVDVTVNPSNFDEGYIGGYVIATSIDGTTIRTPLGWANETEVFDVAVSSDAPLSMVRIFNINTGDFADGTPQYFGDDVVFTMMGGTYIIEALSVSQNSDFGDLYTFMFEAPFDVTGDMSIHLDASQARPVDFDFDQPLVQLPQTIFQFTTPDGSVVFQAGEMLSLGDLVGGNRLAVTPVADTTRGTWSLLVLDSAEVSYLQASVDCGETILPIRSDVVFTEPATYAVVDADLGISAPTSDSILFAHVTNGTDIPTTMGWIEQAVNGGYAGLLVDAQRTEAAWSDLTLSAYGYYPLTYGTDVSIPMFITPRSTGDLISQAGQFSIRPLNSSPLAYRFTTTIDLSDDQPYTVTPDGHTAAVTMRHLGMGPKAVTDRWLTSGGGLLFGGGTSIPAPSSYVIYLESGTPWDISSELSPNMMAEFTADLPMVTYVVPTRTFDAGEQVTYTFDAQASTVTHLSTDVERYGNRMYASTPTLIDGMGSFPSSGFPYGYYQDFGSTTMGLTDLTTSQVLIEKEPSGGLVVDLDPDQHTYQMDVTSSFDGFTLSNEIESTWTWQSSYADSRTEPLREVWYELPGLDAYNDGTESQQIILHVSQTDMSYPAPDQVTLSSSVDDGSSWTNVPVQWTGTAPAGSVGSLRGEDLYTGQIQAHNGDMVWLRVSISGDGSGLVQTVSNAYLVTSQFRDFPSQAWSCDGGGGDVIPPDAPRVDAAGVNGIFGGVGAAEPGSVVIVVFPDGAVGRTTAELDGSYFVETPSGMVSGQIFVTATDGAGNVSDATRVYLDADRPDAPRVDRADMVEVSGGVGAAEAFAQVLVLFPDGSAAQTQAAENGSYRVSTPVGMVVGMVTVTVQDEAGNVSDPTVVELVQSSLVVVTVRYGQRSPGESQVVSGSGFRSLERVTVSLCSSASCSMVKTVSASLSGKVSTSFTVPKSATDGTYTVTLTGVTSGSASATFEVVSPPPSPQCWLDLLVSIWLKLLGF